MMLSRGLIAQKFRVFRTVIVGTALALHACSGQVTGGSITGDGGSTGQTYSPSGTLSGLNSSGLVLLVNGAALSVAPSSKTLQLATALPS
jgi:hypothetical protein